MGEDDDSAAVVATSASALVGAAIVSLVVSDVVVAVALFVGDVETAAVSATVLRADDAAVLSLDASIAVVTPPVFLLLLRRLSRKRCCSGVRMEEVRRWLCEGVVLLLSLSAELLALLLLLSTDGACVGAWLGGDKADEDAVDMVLLGVLSSRRRDDADVGVRVERG